MPKKITNIFIDSTTSINNDENEAVYTDTGKTAIKMFVLDVPPIIIENRAVLKVANICHTSPINNFHGDAIFIFKIDGINYDYSRYISNDGSLPTLISTNFNNSRNLYEENEIPLTKQTINSIRIIPKTITYSGLQNLNLTTQTITTTIADSNYHSKVYVVFIPGSIYGSNLSFTATVNANGTQITISNIITGKFYLSSFTVPSTFTIPHTDGIQTQSIIFATNPTLTTAATPSQPFILDSIPANLNFCISLKIEEDDK